MEKQRPFLQARLRKFVSGPNAPQYSVAFGFGADAADDYYLSLPFKRSLPAILISAVFLIVFSYPLFAMSDLFGAGGDDSLFTLVSMLFSLFWMLGWSIGVAILLFAFLCLSLGKESLHVAGNKLIIRIGIPGIALSAAYNEEPIRNFRYQDGPINEGRQWRGNHIAFDYGDSSIGFGSQISSSESARIISRLNSLFPMHDAAPLEVSESAVEPVVPVTRVSEREPVNAYSNTSVMPVRWNSLSSITLIAANLIPLFGVWLAGWDIGQIMLLFWAESAIIGYYNLCKMWKVGRWSVLFYGPFFVGHYGAFMVAHLLFIYVLFFGELGGEVEINRTQVFDDLEALWPALLGLLISHGLSYYINFVKTNKRMWRSMTVQMREPYRRIMIMHITLILGGFLVINFGTGVGALMLLLLLKIAADLRAHLAQHSR